MVNLKTARSFVIDFLNSNGGTYRCNDVHLTFKEFKRYYLMTFLLNKINGNNYLLHIFDQEKLINKINKNTEIGNVVFKTYHDNNLLESGIFDDLDIIEHRKGFDHLIEDIHCFYKPDVNKQYFDEWLDLVKTHNRMSQAEIDDVLSYVYFEKEEYNNYLN